MFPEAKLAIGPAIENGFYYDFELPRTLIPEDLPLLEEKMRQIINAKYAITQYDEPKEKALEFLKKIDQPYKIELANDIEDKTLSFYKFDNFVDLCAGPHVESTGDLKNIGWKLDKIAGAYWRGDEKNKMLQRIYGLAFETKKEMDEYLANREEAEKRDHKKLGREMDLFSFHAEAPGMPFWHEKGMLIWNALEIFGKKLRKENNFVEIKTPILAKNSLWIKSGHWDHYQDSMFHFELDKETYCLKPMDCPFNIKIYQTKSRSYKDLPIRFTEIGHCHRHEKSGELNGLLRVQEVTQDDSHIFATEDQIKNEISTLLKMVKSYYKSMTLEPKFFLSTRPDDFMGEIKTWDKAEKELKETLEEEGLDYQIKEKDGAFYGPKIDVDIKDALGRAWQVATIQLDFQLPGKFDCEYIDDGGNKKVPVMIHAAIFGSFERMIGILLEHMGGNLPVWMTPVQVAILPVADKHIEFAQKIAKDLSDKNIRVEVDVRSESVGRKIRDAELQKVPFIIVLGDKEIESGKLAVRIRETKEQKEFSVDELFQEIQG
jgi:threonyl-tRNA synthetase